MNYNNGRQVKKLTYTILLLTLSACSHSASTGTPANEPAATTEASTKQPAKPSACAAFLGKPAPKNFQDFEHDKNGEITTVEFRCQVVKEFNQLNADKDSHLAKKEIIAKHAWLKASDSNKDKKLNIVEFMSGADAAFQKADKDKSQSLNKSEFNTGFAGFR